jgi:hypothetical protein
MPASTTPTPTSKPNTLTSTTPTPTSKPNTLTSTTPITNISQVG